MTTEISNFYNGRSVFITGATGFMGKVLIQKLLKACPGLENIYILVRSKKGIKPQDRLPKLLKYTIFDDIRNFHPVLLQKVKVIEGDITSPSFGISEENEAEIIDKVSVIFHSAATVRFDEELGLSMALNVTGTKNAIDLARKLKKLEAFVHVSTAYANCERINEEIKEEIYPALTSPNDMVEMVKYFKKCNFNIDEITPQVIGKRPNTYTFTKALGESLILQEYKNAKFPIAIIRPSIVTATWKDPFPGWVDNYMGMTGIVASVGTGLLRSILIDGRCIADLIPVDIPINLMIAMAWNLSKETPDEIPVYNCTSSVINPYLWQGVSDQLLISLRKFPFEMTFWYPGGTIKTNRLLHNLDRVFFHWIPAYIVDFFMKLFSKKPMLVSIQDKIGTANNVLSYFTTHEWRFPCDNLKALKGKMSEDDKALFDFDISSLNWEKYMDNYIQGTRQHVMRNKPESLQRCRRRLKFQYVLYIFLRCLIVYMFLRLLIFFIW